MHLCEGNSRHVPLTYSAGGSHKSKKSSAPAKEQVAPLHFCRDLYLFATADKHLWTNRPLFAGSADLLTVQAKPLSSRLMLR